MNYTNLFYWLVVADNAKYLFLTGSIVFTIVLAIATLCYFLSFSAENYDYDKEKQKNSQRLCRKWVMWSAPISLLFWSLWVFTPTKKDSLLIVAGGGTLNYLTTDSTAQKIPSKVMNFVVTELDNMALDNNVELNIKQSKQKVLDEAKNMTSEELLNKIKVDSTFRKIITE